MENITVNGVEYTPVVNYDEDMVIVRTYSAGVHYGKIVEQHGKYVTLIRSRRLYYWSGANSLSELATNGVNNPDECKFCVRIDVELTEAIEIIKCTKKAVKIIESVKEWKHE